MTLALLISKGTLSPCSLRNSVSAHFSRKNELDSWSDVSNPEGSGFVKLDELGCFSGDSIEGIIDEGVYDAHGLLGDCEARMDLLEDLIDVDREGLNSSSFGLSASLWFSLLWLSCPLSHFNLFLFLHNRTPYEKRHNSFQIWSISMPNSLSLLFSHFHG